MRLFIAEKPSLAKAIFEGLGGDKNSKMQSGYYTVKQDKVTACFGHMLELFDPEDYDPKLKKWVLKDLPIASQYPPKLKEKEEAKQRLHVIFKLIEEADEIVHAGDPDDEGQLLIDEILNYVGNTKPVKRLLVADLNLAPVKKALLAMKDNQDYIALGQSALARSIADQSFGYNLTRACTLKGREKGVNSVLNVGRVQSAVLGLINQRTLVNVNHQETYYYDIEATFNYQGRLIKAKHSPSEHDQIDEKKRLISESNAQFIVDAVTDNDALITQAITKPESKSPPLPLNLSTLQQLCAKQFGYSAEETLQTAQSLYETHKLLTYPRSDNRYLSDEHYYQSRDIIDAIHKNMSVDNINIDTQAFKHKAFNAERIEAHHAIIPTAQTINFKTLSEQERNVYELAARYFIGLFYLDSIRDKTRVIFLNSDHQFIATQSILVEIGWEQLHSVEKENTIEFDLSQLKFNEKATCEYAEIKKKKTKPPKYFTESTLLAAMTKAASFIDDPDLRKKLEAKDKESSDRGSIGTEATRASILGKIANNAHLVNIEKEKGYKEKVWKTTENGQAFCASLPVEITQPNISAMWTEKQAEIKQGTLTVQAFIRDVDNYIQSQIDLLNEHGLNITSDAPECPHCKKALLLRKGKFGQFWSCSGYPDCKNSYPDKKGQPDLNHQKAEVSNEFLCPVCSKGLIKRKGKKKSTFWGCSGFPTCKTLLFDQAGKPNYQQFEKQNNI
ncbi:DNA topoisomerase [Vibrio sp. SS-MA-C1-2]|uniref:DNA topoisomerase n=1 Tax=Vibrio sp. SS-MA-C1-2 TaxID=2908646 RepID=UPI001F4556E7|nr:DNA topoisomerase [Vibrio sp. SS-MA-C1-2]UJF17243.1 DNA topoisomerase [Vibrio sp. SS-MA-C1-2]